MAHSCPGRVRPRIRCWRKRTPHPRSIPEPNETCLDVQRLDGSGHRPLGLARLLQNVRVVEDGRDQIVTDDHRQQESWRAAQPRYPTPGPRSMPLAVAIRHAKPSASLLVLACRHDGWRRPSCLVDLPASFGRSEQLALEQADVPWRQAGAQPRRFQIVL